VAASERPGGWGGVPIWGSMAQGGLWRRVAECRVVAGFGGCQRVVTWCVRCARPLAVSTQQDHQPGHPNAACDLEIRSGDGRRSPQPGRSSPHWRAIWEGVRPSRPVRSWRGQVDKRNSAAEWPCEMASCSAVYPLYRPSGIEFDDPSAASRRANVGMSHARHRQSVGRAWPSTDFVSLHDRKGESYRSRICGARRGSRGR